MSKPLSRPTRKAAPKRRPAAAGSVRTCEVCGRPLTAKRYDHGDDHRTYWTCDLAEGAWASGAQHTVEEQFETKLKES